MEVKMNFKLFTLLTLALAALVIVTGCSKETSSTAVTDTGTLNYEDEFGGYTTSDEAPGFGDETILNELSGGSEEVVEPEPSMSPIFDSLDADENVNVYRMKILWGQLEGDSTAQDVIDWSGSLEIEYGAIRVATLVKFEGEDHLVRPRNDCTKLEWVSYTKPHYDGIMVFLYDSPDERAESENVVTFTTPEYTRTFSIDELESLSEIVDIDDAGNKISFESYFTSAQEQRNGFLEGRWVKKGLQRGVFYGRFVAYDGRSMGHLRGHFGISRAGDQVFFGKWITAGGQFKGLLRGTWASEDPAASIDPARGTFEGVWANRALTVNGQLGGKWVTTPYRGRGGNIDDDNDPPESGEDVGRIPRARHGFFRGRYAETVPEV